MAPTLNGQSLRSKVARRIFTLFIACALVPVTTLAVVSFVRVSRQLDQQNRDRMSQASKAHGMAVYDRLHSVEAGLVMVAAMLEAGLQVNSLAVELSDRLDALALFEEGQTPRPLLGSPFAPPVLSDEEQQFLDAGGATLSTPGGEVLMTLGVVGSAGSRSRLVARVRPEYLLASEGLGALTAYTVFDPSGRPLTTSHALGEDFTRAVRDRVGQSSSGQLEWSDGADAYLAGYWTLFLKAHYGVDGWTVVLSEPLDYLEGPIRDFRTWFFWIALLTLWVVSLLSLIQIRRHLVPLEALRDGTRRIAARDFGARVTVTSADEFGDLANAFNTMASRLGKQFSTLTTINDIDKAVLSQLKTDDVIETALEHLRVLVPCEELAIGLLAEGGAVADVRCRSARGGGHLARRTVALAPCDTARLCVTASHVIDDSNASTPGYAAPLASRGTSWFLTLPLGRREDLAGFLTFGQATPRRIDEDDLQQIRQVANQLAVALANAKLVEDLDHFNWGTLRTLARAIDAKSPWTAGHSERVSEVAVKIGRILELPSSEITTLERGGLLHDIGKIGVPAAVLDKDDRLTDDEYAVMKDHVLIGASILEPLTAFQDALPIVLEHHEWFDGNGYPHGLAGDELTLGGRIFAVADVFDAVTSARPYRDGAPVETAVDFIRARSGSQFDPKVVEAFLQVMETEHGVILTDDADAEVDEPVVVVSVPA